MEGKSPIASGNTPITKATASSRPLQQEAGRSGAMPTIATTAASEGNHSSTLTLTREQFAEMIQSLNVNVDPALLFAQFRATFIPPTTALQNTPTLQPEADDVPREKERSEGTHEVTETEKVEETGTGEAVEEGEEVEQQLPTTEKDTREPSVIAVVPEETQFKSIPMETATRSEHIQETEQPLLTAEEVAANLAARNSEADEREMEVDRVQMVGWNPTERVEEIVDETPKIREVVDVANEARAAAVRTYQRRLAREETSGRRSAEDQPREIPVQRTREVMNNPVGRAVGASRHIRRRLIVDEPEEEGEEVFFTPIDALPSSGQPEPPTEKEDRERERK